MKSVTHETPYAPPETVEGEDPMPPAGTVFPSVLEEPPAHQRTLKMNQIYAMALETLSGENLLPEQADLARQRIDEIQEVLVATLRGLNAYRSYDNLLSMIKRLSNLQATIFLAHERDEDYASPGVDDFYGSVLEQTKLAVGQYAWGMRIITQHYGQRHPEGGCSLCTEEVTELTYQVDKAMADDYFLAVFSKDLPQMVQIVRSHVPPVQSQA